MKRLVCHTGKTSPLRAAVKAAGFTLIELLVVVSVIGILAAIALPSYHKLKEKAKEAETKAGLHNIQLQIERFSVDNNGNYPDYLIGGNKSAYVEPKNTQGNRPAHIVDALPERISDPLLRLGYVDSYPRNPFVRNRDAVKQYQAANADPLRNMYEDGVEMGTRFGPEGNTMGQLLCDPRWLERTILNHEGARPVQINTWANIQYRCYDIWATAQPKPFLPGSFMYKSMGELMPSGVPGPGATNVKIGDQTIRTSDPRGQTIWPLSNSQYILAAWGGMRNKGLDILGEEPLVTFSTEGHVRSSVPDNIYFYDPGHGGYIPRPRPVTSSFEFIAIPTWTRGVNRTHIGPLWGSPYGVATNSTGQVSIGNPNGIRDALIMVLHSDPESLN